MQQPYEEAMREAIGRKGIKLQEYQTKILEQQTKTLQEQKIFTKILALATFLLAIVAFFSFFDISITSMGLPAQNIFSQIFFAMLAGLGFFVLVMAFFLLLFEIIKLFHKKK